MNPQAIDAFVRHIGEAAARLIELHNFVDDHMGVSPDDVTWANVGDAAALNNALIELMSRVGIDPDNIEVTGA